MTPPATVAPVPLEPKPQTEPRPDIPSDRMPRHAPVPSIASSAPRFPPAHLLPNAAGPAMVMRFFWRGIDAGARLRHGRIEAVDAEFARAWLQRDRIVVLELTMRGTRRCLSVRPADVTLFSRQLAGLLQAGLPLVAALELIARSRTRPRLARVVGILARDITRGLRFAGALQRHPGSFGPLFCQMVALGEASASLAATLTRLADGRDKADAQIARVRSALAYPVGVLILALAITAALLIWVVPTFEQIFAGVGASLPAPTRMVLSLSAALAQYGPVLIAVAAIIAVLIRWAVARSSSFRFQLHRIILQLPLLGPLLRQLCVARWSRALGTLLAAGTSLTDALDALPRATGNVAFDQATGEIAQRLRRGERLAIAMEASGCFPEEVLQPIAVAEESGTLEAMLADLANLNGRQVDALIGNLSNLAEPLIIILLGALIGGLVIAMYLPIIQLGNVV